MMPAAFLALLGIFLVLMALNVVVSPTGLAVLGSVFVGWLVLSGLNQRKEKK